MATRATGISREFIIHPGEMISDVLTERGITQSELAKRTGVSEAYVSSIISGKKDISSRFAMALEYALSVPKSFWLNLQANYDAEILAAEEMQTITDEEKAVCGELREVVKFLRQIGRIPVAQKTEELVLSLRKALQVSNLSNLGSLMPNGAFRMSEKAETNAYVLGAWLQMCQCIVAHNELSATFDLQTVKMLTDDIKRIMLNRTQNPQQELPRVLARYGIDFSIVRNFKGAPVQGYISKKNDGTYQMILTIRGAFADIFWFSLFHEIGHIVNGDVSKIGYFMDVSEELSEREKKADDFAAESLLDSFAYKAFVRKADFSYTSIAALASSQNVPDYIVIGRLQKEKYIPYNWYHGYKLRYKWSN